MGIFAILVCFVLFASQLSLFHSGVCVCPIVLLPLKVLKREMPRGNIKRTKIYQPLKCFLSLPWVLNTHQVERQNTTYMVSADPVGGEAYLGVSGACKGPCGPGTLFLLELIPLAILG